MIDFKNKFLKSLFIFVAIVFASLAVQAKEGKRTTVNFEDQLIKGKNQKPDVLTIFKRKNLNHKRLIRLREHFLEEMRATGNNIDEGTAPKLRIKRKKEKE